MAAESDSSQLSANISKLVINSENRQNSVEQIDLNDTVQYGLPLKDVYKLALSFYKEKEGKAVHFSYEDKLQLVAFSQQVLHGPLVDAIAKLPPLGTLDVVGKDRRVAWQKLGHLSSDQARTGFVELLSRRCTLFSAYVEAHRREKNEQDRKSKELEKSRLLEEAAKIKKDEEDRIIEEEQMKEETIRRQIQQALNAQTYEQFRKYAEQQFPGDPEKQAPLVRQLQDQHYVQYMQQVAQQRAEPVKETPENKDWAASANEEEVKEDSDELFQASMWTRSDIEPFKLSVAQAEGDGVVRVGHGETVTVRVPTHPQGSRLFWEFATDYYDIGFGVYFEFGTPTSNQVSVHVSESEDDDEADDEDFDEEAIKTGDLEAGSIGVNGVSKPLLTEIVPVYRRDCQSEVYAGSHPYPGPGVYLLKFDNSYSLWRSKTLYYRVYYTR